MKFISFSIILFFSFLLSQDIPREITFLHPLPNSQYHRIETNIILRFKSAGKLNPDELEKLINIYDNRGNKIEGQIKSAPD